MSVTDEVKERLDIVEVIQSYVPLKKAGRSYKGLCPFHTEKTPSFIVFPDTGTWHCFGACGTGGDLFTFIMKRENLDFAEALQLLARRAGVEIKPPTPQATEAERRQTLLRDINQKAASYFHFLLQNADEAAAARAYLEKRGLKRDTLDRFQVGYALDQWDGMLRFLTSRGFTPADIAEAGLVVERDDKSGYYDRFRGRIIFAIRDAEGRPIGFGGRVLGQGLPKYINSPQTPLFDKSSALYGLDLAKQGIRTSGVAVIVEGYMDVLMAHQHGLNNVVAQMGTALTEAQLKMLKRYTQRFVLALDSDAAGDQATLRGLDVARQVLDREVVPVPTPRGLIRFEEQLAADIRIVSLPPGLDPDEVIRDSPARWAQLLAQARPVMDYYFRALTAGLDLAAARDKAEAVRLLGPLVAELSNRVQRTHYLQQLGRMVQMDERALWQQIRQTPGARPAADRHRPPPPEKPKKTVLELDEHCLSVLLRHPTLLGSAQKALEPDEGQGLDAADFRRPDDRALFAAWCQWLAGDPVANARGPYYDTLDEALQQRLDELLQTPEGQPAVPDDLLREDLADVVIRLRLRNLSRRVDELHFLLEDKADVEAAASYRRQAQHLAGRKRALQKALDERSMSGRRQREDALVRISVADT